MSRRAPSAAFVSEDAGSDTDVCPRRSFIAEMQMFVKQLGRSKAPARCVVIQGCRPLDRRLLRPPLRVRRDHRSRARLQQEAGGPVLRSVSGETAVPPRSRRGVLRGHQEEGGGDGTAHTAHVAPPGNASSESLLLFCVQLEAFEVKVSPDLQQQLTSVVQELGVTVPPAVSPSETHRRSGQNQTWSDDVHVDLSVLCSPQTPAARWCLWSRGRS